MICKKCGSNIADSSKFCGYCGTPVEKIPSVEQNQNIYFDIAKQQESNLQTENFDRVREPIVNEESVKIEPISPINPTIDNLSNEVNKVDSSIQTVDTQNSISQESMNPQFNNENALNNNNIINQPINGEQLGVSQSFVNQMPVNMQEENKEVEPQSVQIEPLSNQPNKNKKSNNKLIFLILGIVLVVAGLVVLLMTFFGKTSSSSIDVLNKALANIEQNANQSATVDAKILVENKTQDSMNFSATLKYQKINDNYNMNLVLNKSLLYDEINIYSKINDKDISFYIPSNIIDNLIGYTHSDNDIWLKDTEILENLYKKQQNDLNLNDIIDEKHFVYVDSNNKIRHYKLIVDQELLDKIESNYKDVLDEEFIDNEAFEQSNLIDSYEIDFYINSSDIIEKISMEINDFSLDEDISKIVLSLEFSNFNSTNVTIPDAALNSNVTIDEYVNTYSIQDNQTADDNINEF